MAIAGKNAEKFSTGAQFEYMDWKFPTKIELCVEMQTKFYTREAVTPHCEEVEFRKRS